MAAKVVPGLRVQGITVRDDRRRGLVADIAATGAAATVHQTLAGYTAPYDLHWE